MRVCDLLSKERCDLSRLVAEKVLSGPQDEKVVWKRFGELLEALAAGPPGEVQGTIVLRELRLSSPSAPWIAVAVDWFDHGRLEDGIPVTHYRIRAMSNNGERRETRRATAAEAAEVILGFVVG
jgi:hypothetical protein